ncbi:transposase [Sharpea porci]|uniref:transposase n=1 Tax=Sharpea porci TaxID=2652286 RepID=UPI0038B313AD
MAFSCFSHRKQKEKVEFVCSDSYEPYCSIIATYFKSATYLINHFHVSRKHS